LLSLVSVAGAEPSYEFKLRKAADTIVAVKEKERTVILVTSPGGIGQGTITLKAGQWPENVTLRLQHDKGKPFANLERIDLTADRIRVEGNLKSSGQFKFCFLDAKRTPVAIDQGTPSNARAPAGTMNVRVEKRDHGMDVVLPACLLIGSAQVELSWVDAYRN
jgi:hypothetical protein